MPTAKFYKNKNLRWIFKIIHGHQSPWPALIPVFFMNKTRKPLQTKSDKTSDCAQLKNDSSYLPELKIIKTNALHKSRETVKKSYKTDRWVIFIDWKFCKSISYNGSVLLPSKLFLDIKVLFSKNYLYCSP